MDSRSTLKAERLLIPELLRLACDEAVEFLRGVRERPANTNLPEIAWPKLPAQGLGARQTLALFRDTYRDALACSAGPRYFGFVTGGTTPAAIMGDWLTSAYDQNASHSSSQAASQIELQAMAMLRDLFDLPETFSGRFVSGATMSNFVGLAIGRQWWGRQHGRDIAGSGLSGMPKLVVFSGAPHACIYKSLAMLGLGRESLQLVPLLPNREAIDIAALRQLLELQVRQPCLVVANAGTVDTADFDDIAAIAQLQHEFNFYLHVDAAFGGFAACSSKHKQLLAGWECADSIAIDAHKWLNVPYDSAIQFSRRVDLQIEVFQNAAASYLSPPNADDAFHLTPENSRRWRALSAWFGLMAYGAEGYREIVESNCACASLLGQKIAASVPFRLLAPVRMNIVLFTFCEATVSAAQVTTFLNRLRDNGKAFLTPTIYQGTRGIRAALSNWRTTPEDVEIAWQGMLEAANF